MNKHKNLDIEVLYLVRAKHSLPMPEVVDENDETDIDEYVQDCVQACRRQRFTNADSDEIIEITEVNWEVK